MFLDFSSRDLHLATTKSDAKEIYDKTKMSPRYVGYSLSEKVVDDFIQEFLKRRKLLDMRKFMNLFPEFDTYTDYLTMEKMELLFPDVAEEFGLDKLVDIVFNPKEEDDETLSVLKANNKVTIKKDNVEIINAFSF